MIPIRDIKAEDIQAVIYVRHYRVKRPASNLITIDGHIHTYNGDDLALALALANRLNQEKE